MYEVELYHHGIKGQKWGVRRFQKLDGTLTALGRRLANDGRVPKSIRDRAQFAVAKRTYQTPVEFTSAHQWNKKRHFPNAEMYKPSTDLADPRHYKNDSLYKGPEAYTQKRRQNSSTYDDIMRQGMQRLQFNKELDRRAEEKRNKYYEQLYSDGLKSAQNEAAAAKSRTPTFFTDSNGVKKERLSAEEEANIAKGLSYNTADFRAKDAKLRNEYENARVGGFDGTLKTSDVYSYDQYLRKTGNSDHADKRSAINTAKANDEYRTWHNGQASQREQSRRDSLNAVQNFEKRKAITEANRQAAEAKNRNYQQAMNRSNNYQKYVNSDAFKRDMFDSLSRTMSSKQAQGVFNTMRSQLEHQTPIGNRHINSFSSSSTRYQQAATRVSSAAKQRVSAYATKARTSAGKAFTNYMTKMADAAKTIDADLWSF